MTSAPLPTRSPRGRQESRTAIPRPSLALLGAEPFRAAFELARHHLGPSDCIRPGNGHPVVIFPGLGADGRSVARLRDHCRAQGYAAFDWGQGFNTGSQGDLDTWLETLRGQVAELLEGHAQPATLIGWSLGGLYAREIAKLMAPQVHQVITLGTPFNADADHTHAGWLYRLLSGGPTPLDAALSERLRTPPPMRTASIYSRSDGVVAWQACRHAHTSRWIEDIEVDGSHLGMGWNPEVLAAVSDRLGQAPGPWRRYRPGAAGT